MFASVWTLRDTLKGKALRYSIPPESQRFILLRQVWYQVTNPGKMECLVGKGLKSEQEPGAGARDSWHVLRLRYTLPLTTYLPELNGY